MRVTTQQVLIGAAALAAVGLGVYVWRRGAANLGKDAGAAAVGAVGGAVSGAVGAAGATVGLPTPDETTTDPAVARWIIDRAGYLAASQWAGALALVRGAMMPSGSGTPPPAGTAVARAFGVEEPKPIRRTMDEQPDLSRPAYMPIWAFDPITFADGARP